MKLRHGLTLIALAVLLATALPGQARGARAVPDSLVQLRAMLATARPTDPALPALAERIVSRREAARRARPAAIGLRAPRPASGKSTNTAPASSSLRT